jgi:hypothetical protein
MSLLGIESPDSIRRLRLISGRSTALFKVRVLEDEPQLKHEHFNG